MAEFNTIAQSWNNCKDQKLVLGFHIAAAFAVVVQQEKNQRCLGRIGKLSSSVPVWAEEPAIPLARNLGGGGLLVLSVDGAATEFGALFFAVQSSVISIAAFSIAAALVVEEEEEEEEAQSIRWLLQTIIRLRRRQKIVCLCSEHHGNVLKLDSKHEIRLDWICTRIWREFGSNF